MRVELILKSIDNEIARLTQARALLSSTGGAALPKVKTVAITKTRRRLSAAARKRIGDAQRKRWAAAKAKAK